MEFSLSELNDVLGDIKNLKEGKRDFLNFKNISIDSRTLLKNDLFIANKGKNFDGHSFLPEVLNKGVKSVVIKKGMQKLLPSNFPYWAVNDTLEAFQKLALLKRKKLNIPVQVLWGKKGVIGKQFKPIKIWQKYSNKKVIGVAVKSGHFIPEQNPKETIKQLKSFFLKNA